MGIFSSLFGSGAKHKRIVYRGGIATFEVPTGWAEHYEAEGGGTFYDDRPDSGTLRLNVLSFQSEGEPASQMALSAFKGAHEVRPDGLPMRCYVEPADEDGQALEIHRWEVAVPVPPHSMRLALFSYTILKGQQANSRIREELAVVDSLIRNAAFSKEPGVPAA